MFLILHSDCEKYLTVNHFDDSTVAIMLWTRT